MARRYGKTAKEYRREVAREEADDRSSQAYNDRLGYYNEEIRRASGDERRKLEEQRQADFIATFSDLRTSTSSDDALAKTLITLGMIAAFLAVIWALLSS